MKLIRYFVEKLTLIILFKNWYVIPISVLKIDRFLGINSRLVLRNGYQIYYNDFHSLWPFKEIFLDNAYNLYIQKDKITIFDIGANIGAFTLFANSVYPKCTIYSFEPSKENYLLLKKNIKVNDIKSKIRALNLAVGAKKEVRLIDETGDSTMRKISQNDGQNRNLSKVSVIRIDEFIKENKIKCIDFMKIDIEGGEYEVLYSMPKSVYKKIKIISLEYHNIDKIRNGRQLSNFLEGNGYTLRHKRINDTVGLIYAVRY